jgi:hypothetical protein
MFKKLLFHAIVLVIAFPPIVLAAGNPDTGPGCGLGKLAWQDYKGQKEIAPQVMMATTNGTFGSQTFGLSFGTSGCINNGVIMKDMKAQAFTETMFANLSKDMARGGGEHLTSLATLLGVPAQQQPAFFEMAQERYAELVESGEQSPVALMTAIHNAMAEHPVLAQLSATR